MMLGPMIVFYEVGVLVLRATSWPERGLVAQRLVQQLAAWFGAGGVFTSIDDMLR